MSSSEQGNFVRCPVCITTFQRGNWTSHINGGSHISKAQRRGMRPDVDPEVPEAVAGHRKCTLCNIFVAQNGWNTHITSSTHVAHESTREAARQMEAELLQASADHEGLLLSHQDGVDFGVVDPSAPVRVSHKEIIARGEEGKGNFMFVQGTSHMKIPSAPPTTFVFTSLIWTFNSGLFPALSCPPQVPRPTSPQGEISPSKSHSIPLDIKGAGLRGSSSSSRRHRAGRVSPSSAMSRRSSQIMKIILLLPRAGRFKGDRSPDINLLKPRGSFEEYAQSALIRIHTKSPCFCTSYRMIFEALSRTGLIRCWM